ncbi:MAG: M3 family oligoendopeptidase, partial [Fusobacteriaceae bacterium]
MKFSQYQYTRPNYEEDRKNFLGIIEEIKNSQSLDEQFQKIQDAHVLRGHIQTAMTLSSIRYTINTEDKFYKDEKTYWDKTIPLYEEIFFIYNKTLLESPFKKELEERLSKQFFRLAQLNIKSFSPEVIPELQEENNLITQYIELIASAKIKFMGRELNISGLTPYTLSHDRELRKMANDIKYDFFKEKENEIDEIFEKLVKIRDKIAKKLGFKNFVELGYARMRRTDYNPEMVENFRNQVQKYIVPLASELYEKQRKRLELDELKHYDEKFEFSDGNAIPKGDSNWILENAKKMYDELSPETSEFFSYMIDHELMDLVTKKGKSAGGYCTYIWDYGSPFIFANFNGTSGDIDVMTHEAGHAFQVYLSRWVGIPGLNCTYESAEVHSMSMEFFTWPWMELFFKEDTAKYKFTHLGGAIKFIPYGVTVDAFQHFIYENPDATQSERKSAWRELEKKYLPHKNYSESDFLERGGWWFQQAHIFKVPFYYIDYTLAQICALQFWKNMKDDREGAWQDYINVSNVGGTCSFLELLERGNIVSPFLDECVPSVIEEIRKELE